jgi:hypothetical protein
MSRPLASVWRSLADSFWPHCFHWRRGFSFRSANFPAFQTRPTARIISCGATGVTDNDDEYLATRAVREGLRRDDWQNPACSLELNADSAIRSGRN